MSQTDETHRDLPETDPPTCGSCGEEFDEDTPLLKGLCLRCELEHVSDMRDGAMAACELLQHERDEARAEVERLNARSIVDLRGNLVRAEGERDAAREDQANTEIELNAMCANDGFKLERIKELEAEMRALRQRLAEVERECALYRDTAGERRSGRATMKLHGEDVDKILEWKMELRTAKELIAVMEERLRKLEDENDDLCQRFVVRGGELAALNEKLRAACAMRDGAMAGAERLQHELEETQRSLRIQEQMYQSAAAERAEERTRVERLRQTLETIIRTTTDMQAEHLARAALARGEGECALYRDTAGELRRLESENATLTAERDALAEDGRRLDWLARALQAGTASRGVNAFILEFALREDEYHRMHGTQGASADLRAFLDALTGHDAARAQRTEGT